jgi:hypothetical protein
MNTLEDLAMLREEEKGSEDEPSDYAYSSMESVAKVVVESNLPQPSLCSLQDDIIAEWHRNKYGRAVRLRCAGSPEERSYIYWSDGSGSGIEDANIATLISRLQWYAQESK